MYSTTTLAKDPKLNGKLMGTHQLFDQAARKTLQGFLPTGQYFPSAKEIIYFEGARGPDALKRKSPGEDEPSTMYDEPDGELLLAQIEDHYANLVIALKDCNHVRAAFEAAWMAHKLIDGLTPAHHFPLDDAKEELMSKKEFVQIFGEPIKGVMRGRTPLETMRNNWLYWGAGGYMTKHIAYEYGVAILVAALPRAALRPKMASEDFDNLEPAEIFRTALEKIQPRQIYDDFRENGWTTELAFDTKNLVAPECVRAITRLWYTAACEAYGLASRTKSATKSKSAPSASKNMTKSVVSVNKNVTKIASSASAEDSVSVDAKDLRIAAQEDAKVTHGVAQKINQRVSRRRSSHKKPLTRSRK